MANPINRTWSLPLSDNCMGFLASQKTKNQMTRQNKFIPYPVVEQPVVAQKKICQYSTHKTNPPSSLPSKQDTEADRKKRAAHASAEMRIRINAQYTALKKELSIEGASNVKALELSLQYLRGESTQTKDTIQHKTTTRENQGGIKNQKKSIKTLINEIKDKLKLSDIKTSTETILKHCLLKVNSIRNNKEENNDKNQSTGSTQQYIINTEKTNNNGDSGSEPPINFAVDKTEYTAQPPHHYMTALSKNPPPLSPLDFDLLENEFPFSNLLSLVEAETTDQSINANTSTIEPEQTKYNSVNPQFFFPESSNLLFHNLTSTPLVEEIPLPSDIQEGESPDIQSRTKPLQSDDSYLFLDLFNNPLAVKNKEQPQDEIKSINTKPGNFKTPNKNSSEKEAVLTAKIDSLKSQNETLRHIIIQSQTNSQQKFKDYEKKIKYLKNQNIKLMRETNQLSEHNESLTKKPTPAPTSNHIKGKIRKLKDTLKDAGYHHNNNLGMARTLDMASKVIRDSKTLEGSLINQANQGIDTKKQINLPPIENKDNNLLDIHYFLTETDAAYTEAYSEPITKNKHDNPTLVISKPRPVRKRGLCERLSEESSSTCPKTESTVSNWTGYNNTPDAKKPKLVDSYF